MKKKSKTMPKGGMRGGGKTKMGTKMSAKGPRMMRGGKTRLSEGEGGLSIARQRNFGKTMPDMPSPGIPGMAKGKKVPSNGDNKKLDMVAKDGKMVPFYAADGKGKMGHGGVIKTMKKMYRGGLTSKTEPKGGKS